MLLTYVFDSNEKSRRDTPLKFRRISFLNAEKWLKSIKCSLHILIIQPLWTITRYNNPCTSAKDVCVCSLEVEYIVLCLRNRKFAINDLKVLIVTWMNTYILSDYLGYFLNNKISYKCPQNMLLLWFQFLQPQLVLMNPAWYLAVARGV